MIQEPLFDLPEPAPAVLRGRLHPPRTASHPAAPTTADDAHPWLRRRYGTRRITTVYLPGDHPKDQTR